MAEALFSGTRQKVLGLLFGQPGREFSLSELIRLASAGSGAVQREVQRLADAGLIGVRGEGRPKLYRANPESPVFAELCSLSKKILGPAEVLRSVLEPIQDTIQLALIFGSVAKGTDRADSDIDLLIISDHLMLEDIYSRLAGVEHDLGRRINLTLYTSSEFDRRRHGNSPFLTDVLRGDYQVLFGELP